MTSQTPEVGLAPPPARSERDPTNRATIRCRFSAAFTPSRGFFSRAFTANENLPRSAVEALCAEGHNVAWVRAEAPGATDEQVLARARSDGRVLLTFDKDFGELVLKRGRSASHGVVLFRMPLERPADVASRVVEALRTRDDWANHFSVVESQRIRMRPLVA